MDFIKYVFKLINCLFRIKIIDYISDANELSGVGFICDEVSATKFIIIEVPLWTNYSSTDKLFIKYFTIKVSDYLCVYKLI